MEQIINNDYDTNKGNNGRIITPTLAPQSFGLTATL
jgi:hypothetical protein